MVTLGDSVGVGMGDPHSGGGWRGVGPLLATALGATRHVNLAVPGARARCVRTDQIPAALQARPELAVVLVGMNDTLRSDFCPAGLRRDFNGIFGGLAAGGCTALTVLFHDHARVFRLPAVLRNPLRRRIEQLNEVIDDAVTRHGARSVRLDLVPGIYTADAWSVDRLHPSEIGYRLLADAFATQAVTAGWRLAEPVGLSPAGGRPTTTLQHVAWLVGAGVPWLLRRGRDLVPYAVSVAVREMLRPARENEPVTGLSAELRERQA